MADETQYSLGIPAAKARVVHMNAAGLIVAAACALLLLPLLPFIVVYYLLAGASSGSR
ncbi:DUF7535 family protein [Halobaculum sp. D14]|uniref:DUF7535 family protein n=1 Tax=unclassified Halobaculum TaxID=2640896 RepID=UPI003EC12737